VEGHENNSTKATARKQKGQRLVRELRWKAAGLQVKGGLQKGAQNALGIGKVKALVHVCVPQLTCLAFAVQC